MTDAITIQNPRNRGGSTGHVLAKRSVTFTEIRSQAGEPIEYGHGHASAAYGGMALAQWYASGDHALRSETGS